MVDLALKTLENGIARFGDAPAIDRARSFLYRAELAVRLHDHAWHKRHWSPRRSCL
jgi:hypothetical protein